MSLLLFLKNILQLVLSPTNGWKDIEDADMPFERLISTGLYPLMSVMLLSVFIRPLYGFEDFNLIELLQAAVIQFVALFVTLYASRAIMEHYLPVYNATGQHDPVAVGNVAVYGTGLLTVIQLIENLVPIELTVMQLLPALDAVCIWKSERYLDVEKGNEVRFMLICVTSLIAPVILINLIVSAFIS